LEEIERRIRDTASKDDLVSATDRIISTLLKHKYKEILPSEIELNASLNYPRDKPFPTPKLTLPQRYHYERLSQKLYRIFDHIKDPNQLDAESRANYRDLVKIVGRAALSMKHFTKALEIVVHLEPLTDRALNADESFLIGNAYLWAADELSKESERMEYFRKAVSQHNPTPP
jgi:hypothetical protein